MEVLNELRELAVTLILWVQRDPVRVGGFLTVLSFTSSGVVALLNRHEKDP